MKPVPATLPSPLPTRSLQPSPTRPCRLFCKSEKKNFTFSNKYLSWLDGHLFATFSNKYVSWLDDHLFAYDHSPYPSPTVQSCDGLQRKGELCLTIMESLSTQLLFDNNGEFVNINDMGSCVWQRRVCEHHLYRPFIMTKTSSGKKVRELRKLTSSSSKRDSTQAHTQNHLKQLATATSLLGGFPDPCSVRWWSWLIFVS